MVARTKDPDATARCSRCGRKIVWGSDREGNKIPLDPAPAVYKIWARKNLEVYVDRDRNAMVSHFATCNGKGN